MPTLLSKQNGHLLRKANGRLAIAPPVQWYRVYLTGYGVFRGEKELDYSDEVPPYNYQGNPATYYDPPSYHYSNQAACDSEFAAATTTDMNWVNTYKMCDVGSLSYGVFRGARTWRASYIAQFTGITPVDNPTSNRATGSKRNVWGILRFRQIQQGVVSISGSVSGSKHQNHNLSGASTGLSFGVNFGAFASAAPCTGNFAATSSGSGGTDIDVSASGLAAIKNMMTDDSIIGCGIKVGVGISGAMPTFFGDPEYYGSGPGGPWLIIATGGFSVNQQVVLNDLWIRI